MVPYGPGFRRRPILENGLREGPSRNAGYGDGYGYPAPQYPGREGLAYSTLSAGFPERAFQTGVVFNNKMWVIGGHSAGNSLDDVWFSGDGAIWNGITASAAFPPRLDHTSLVFNNAMWVIAGGITLGDYNDVWHSPF